MSSNGSDHFTAESIIYALAVAWTSAVCVLTLVLTAQEETGVKPLTRLLRALLTLTNSPGGHGCEALIKATVCIFTLISFGP